MPYMTDDMVMARVLADGPVIVVASQEHGRERGRWCHRRSVYSVDRSRGVVTLLWRDQAALPGRGYPHGRCRASAAYGRARRIARGMAQLLGCGLEHVVEHSGGASEHRVEIAGE